MTTPLHRVRLIFRRWTSLVCCGTVAATIIAIVYPLLQRLFAPVVDRLSAFNPTTIAIILVVLLGTVCWFVGRGRWRGFLGVRFFFLYPPLWVAVLIAIGLLLEGRIWLNGISSVQSLLQALKWFYHESPLLIWTAIFLFVVWAAVVSFGPELVAVVRRFWNCILHHVDSKHPHEIEDFTSLRDWLRDDSPIDTPSLDLFHHDDIARRMAERLCQKNNASTMALIGRLGSGKSTIHRLVAYHLQNNRNVRLIRVSLWPFTSAEAAVRGILQAIIAELGRHVNILPIVGLSEDYITVIEKTAGAYGGIARMFHGAEEPQKILEQFSEVVCATGLRFVLWIEDLERFSGGDQLEGPARYEREAERLGPVRSFLYLLDLCEEVSVVVADTSLQTRFDIGKIARFVEQVPEMEVEKVWKFTNLIRKRCLNGYPVAVIDPTAPQMRELLVPKQSLFDFRHWLTAFSNIDTTNVFEAVVEVLKTPRAIKGTLRRTLEIWEAMPGEIDFDAVLVANALREVYPNLFTLVDDYIFLFCYGFENPLTQGEEAKTPHEVVDRIEKLLKLEKQRTAIAIRSMLHFLFPKYPPNDNHKAEEEKEYLRPQAMFVNSHVNYWQRYQSQAQVSETDSDQRALASIAAWRSGKNNDLINRMINPQHGHQIESFVNQFDPNDLCRLLDEVVDRVSTQSAAEWDHQYEAPGIRSVWQMMRNRKPQQRLVYQTVKKIVERIAPAHLPLVHNVVCFLASNDSNHFHIMPDNEEKAVRNQLQNVLAENFVGQGAEQRLVDALKDGPPWLMREIVFINGDDHAALPFSRWPEFSKVLLTLAEKQPAIGVPLVVGLIAKSDLTPSSHLSPTDKFELEMKLVGQFDEKAARRLFDYERLVSILSKFEIPDDLSDDMKEACRVAVNAAQAEMSLH